jgi:hypothetical protein
MGWPFIAAACVTSFGLLQRGHRRTRES